MSINVFDDYDDDTFDKGLLDEHYIIAKTSRTTLGDLLKSMTTEDTKPMSNSDYTAYLFTFEINNSFESFDKYSNDPLHSDMRLYTENKVYFIKLIRSLLDVCGLKEAKDLVECDGQPHRQFRDDDGVDWHSFTVRITTVDTAMRIMMFLLKILTATDRYSAMRAEVGQIFHIRNARMQSLHNLDYFTIS